MAPCSSHWCCLLGRCDGLLLLVYDFCLGRICAHRQYDRTAYIFHSADWALLGESLLGLHELLLHRANDGNVHPLREHAARHYVGAYVRFWRFRSHSGTSNEAIFIKQISLLALCFPQSIDKNCRRRGISKVLSIRRCRHSSAWNCGSCFSC